MCSFFLNFWKLKCYENNFGLWFITQNCNNHWSYISSRTGKRYLPIEAPVWRSNWLQIQHAVRRMHPPHSISFTALQFFVMYFLWIQHIFKAFLKMCIRKKHAYVSASVRPVCFLLYGNATKSGSWQGFCDRKMARDLFPRNALHGS